MQAPGPPQFTTVGSGVELAPRDPTPDASYAWDLVETPAESTAEIGDDPVTWLVPDVPGTYVAELTGPGDEAGERTTARQTVRVYPARERVGDTDAPVGASGPYASGDADFAGDDYPNHGDGGDGGRPRVRLDGGREGDEVVLTATPTAPPGDDAPPSAFDVEFVPDDRDGLSPADLSVEGHAARVPLDAIDGSVRVHAVAVGERPSVADAVRVHEDGTVERLNDPPEWATEATIYEVYVRAFAEEGDDGAVFSRLESRLPYFADLGIDTLWLTPILQNDDAPHGYNITDFFAVADDLGTREDFERFVERAHDHGIKVLFDLVLNHSARQHPYYQAALDGDPTYKEWYEWEDYEAGQPATYFDWHLVANLNLANLEVRRHLLDVVDEWAPLVDGFRCDMAWAVSHGFWKEIRERVHALGGEEFLLLDETIPYVADFHELEFDVHFDTTTYFTLRQIGRAAEPAEALLDAVEQRAGTGFPDHAAFMLYLENHDEVRYVEECGEDEVRAAAAAQFTLPGVPMLYSGQERGMRERRAVDWTSGDDELEAFYRSLIATRDALDPLGVAGEFDHVDYESESEGVVAYARETESERYVVVLNFGPGHVPVYLAESCATTDEVTGQDVTARAVDDGTEVRVDSVAVLEGEP